MTTLIPKYDFGATGAVNRAINFKFQESVSVKDFGATGNGTTDDTAAIQAAINSVSASSGAFQLFVPAGVYRCTAPLVVSSEMSILGVGASPYHLALATIGNGSWFFFDHTGYGIHIVAPPATVLSGIELRNFGTYRTQPAGGVGWVPTAHDFDIFITGSDVLIEDLMLLNPTKGISLTSAGYGRLQISRVRGCAFQVLIYISESFDTTHINDIHQWPFDAPAYSDAYQLANLDVLWFARNDNPIISNFFAIFARSNIRISQGASGPTYQLHGSNMLFDRCRWGLWIEAGADGFSGRLVNVIHQGETSAVANSMAVFVQGDNSNIQLENFQSNAANWNTIRVQGTGNILHLGGNINCIGYDASLSGYPAIESSAAGNTFYIAGIPYCVPAAGSTAGKYGAAGATYVDEWRDYTPTVTSSVGAITSYTATGKYKLYGNGFSYSANVSMTDNGTGSSVLLVTIPFATSASAPGAVGCGFNSAGASLSSTVVSGATAITNVRTYNNAYPTATGGTLTVTGVVIF